MGPRDRVMAGVAGQLGRPHGAGGQLVAHLMNRGNRRLVMAAVSSTEAQAGQVVADVGFGGGVGLRPLLDRVSPGGHVHGVELSETALAMARRRFSTETATGALILHAGDLVHLPLPDDALDAAITVNTIYFVDDLTTAFAELARTLRVGGRLVIGVADPAAMSTMRVTAHGFTVRPVDHLVTALHDAGFDDLRDERVGTGERASHLLVAERTRAR